MCRSYGFKGYALSANGHPFGTRSISNMSETELFINMYVSCVLPDNRGRRDCVTKYIAGAAL